jgi:penicillin-binding protein 1A
MLPVATERTGRPGVDSRAMRKSPGLALAASLTLLGTLLSACGLPRLQDYRTRPLAQTTFVFAADGSLITSLHAREDRVVLGSDQMPDSIREAAVAIEDRRFYWHHGVDLQAIVRAAYEDADAGHLVEGGSTITQQLVKNLYVGDADTFKRKLDEAVLAWQLEDRMTKEQIITQYLNTVYFGEGAYGVEAAAETYFAEHAGDLSVGESAMLAGLISAPNHFDPFVNPSSARGRRNVVLRLMRKQGFISRRALGKALAESLRVHHNPVGRADRYRYPYFVDYLKRWFLTNPAFGPTRGDRERLLFTGGLQIVTTLDPNLQASAETAVHSVLAYPNDPSGAMTVLDPRTGYVRAMVGGNDADYWANRGTGRVNLATGAGGTGRQTGSAFKPFALVTALEAGISPAAVYAAPASIDIPEEGGRIWHVTNAEGNGYGSMSLESATVDSVNTVYAQLIHQLGATKVVETARRMGLRCCERVGEPRTPLVPFDSAVLGTNEVNTLEMASAYGTLAAGGQHLAPVPAVNVTDSSGNVIWQAHPSPTQVLDPQIASVADAVLQQVVLYGTGSSANIGRPQIGKTGTAEHHANAWFIGAVPQLVAAVWVGFPRGNIPMEPPATRIPVLGGTWPAAIWRLFMVRATADMPVREFPTPPVGYVSVPVDVTQDPYCLPNPFTLPANIETLQFINGTQPAIACTTPTSLQHVVVPSVIGTRQNRAETALEKAGFHVVVEMTQSTQPPGTVVYQSPQAGTDAFQTTTVTITVGEAAARG